MNLTEQQILVNSEVLNRVNASHQSILSLKDQVEENVNAAAVAKVWKKYSMNIHPRKIHPGKFRPRKFI